MPLAFAVSGAAFLIHEQNALALLALGVPAPPPRLDAAHRGALPARRDRPAALARVATPASRSCSSCSRSSLYSDRDVAPIFGHLVAARRGAAPMRRRVARRGARRARAARRRPRRTRRSRRRSPTYGSGSSSRPRVVRLDFDQSVEALPNAIQVYDADGKLVSGPRTRRPTGRVMVAPAARLPRGALHGALAARSRPTAHVVSGVFTFGVRREGAAADGGVRRGRADDGRSTSSAGCTSSALALLVGGLGFRLLIVRAARYARGSSGASTS